MRVWGVDDGTRKYRWQDQRSAGRACGGLACPPARAGLLGGAAAGVRCLAGRGRATPSRVRGRIADREDRERGAAPGSPVARDAGRRCAERGGAQSDRARAPSRIASTSRRRRRPRRGDRPRGARRALAPRTRGRLAALARYENVDSRETTVTMQDGSTLHLDAGTLLTAELSNDGRRLSCSRDAPSSRSRTMPRARSRWTRRARARWRSARSSR